MAAGFETVTLPEDWYRALKWAKLVPNTGAYSLKNTTILKIAELLEAEPVGVWVEVPGTPGAGERFRMTAEGAWLVVRDGKYYQFVVGATTAAKPFAVDLLVSDWAKAHGIELDYELARDVANLVRAAAKRFSAPKTPLTEEQVKNICYVGPVYAPSGIVERTPAAYVRELEAARLHGIREAERAHGISKSAN